MYTHEGWWPPSLVLILYYVTDISDKNHYNNLLNITHFKSGFPCCRAGSGAVLPRWGSLRWGWAPIGLVFLRLGSLLVEGEGVWDCWAGGVLGRLNLSMKRPIKDFFFSIVFGATGTAGARTGSSFSTRCREELLGEELCGGVMLPCLGGTGIATTDVIAAKRNKAGSLIWTMLNKEM